MFDAAIRELRIALAELAYDDDREQVRAALRVLEAAGKVDKRQAEAWLDAAILFLRSLLRAKPYGDADGLKLYEHNFGWDDRDVPAIEAAIRVLEAAAKVPKEQATRMLDSCEGEPCDELIALVAALPDAPKDGGK